ncbi:MAG: amidohydrolase family protein [Puia sp.]|nr:amidohydrolase family protein [Puia sp.]
MKDFTPLPSFCLFAFVFFTSPFSPPVTLPAASGFVVPGYYTADDFDRVEKIDSHVHFNTDSMVFIRQAAEDHFRLLTINLDDINEPPPMEVQQEYSLREVRAFPHRIAYATTFSIRDFNEPGWQERTLAYLQHSFDSGAIAVKIYKVIGMSLKDSNGRMVMIDDPRFDPVIDFIEQHHIPVLGHLGEPRNCWQPLEKMTIRGDRNYYSHNPAYHMFLHPELPSYEAQIAARDHMLEKHPGLVFIGAHLGSLEWDTDELARRLDKFPNMAVDMAARISHLQRQASENWKKVHDFMIKYQDRLLYATDMGVDNTTDPVAFSRNAHASRLRDWHFFVTDEEMSSREFAGGFRGLHLPKEVVDKIYRENAKKCYPGLRKL